MPASPSPMTKHTNALGRLLSKANVSFESGREWARVNEIFKEVNGQVPRNPDGLRPGPLRNLLDVGLVPFLTKVLQDHRVRYSPEDFVVHNSTPEVSTYAENLILTCTIIRRGC